MSSYAIINWRSISDSNCSRSLHQSVLIGLQVGGGLLLAIAKAIVVVVVVALEPDVVGGDEAVPVAVYLVAEAVFEGVVAAFDLVAIAIV